MRVRLDVGARRGRYLMVVHALHFGNNCIHSGVRQSGRELLSLHLLNQMRGSIWMNV
jgi:hypothetical protein